jgi:poly(3-hydroxybutyrate) depolymerase
MNVTVDGMGHAWSGAKKTGTYLDPNGPDAGLMMWQFLSHFAGT